jgi:hypothetical protein
MDNGLMLMASDALVGLGKGNGFIHLDAIELDDYLHQSIREKRAAPCTSCDFGF